MNYCPSLYHYQRRPSRVVKIGSVAVGGKNPIRVQSMLTSSTEDTEACVNEALELADVGCEIIRLTAQTKKVAANLEHIAKRLRQEGCGAPLVADIHFLPDAAFEAAKWVEKVRVNPGNYADKKKFATREYTDAQYHAELERVDAEFGPLVDLCRERGVAIRIGTNHGSLSDRIMNRYGDTPLGMVESALEFAKIARSRNFHDLVFSMKASNPKVMIAAYRLLVKRLAAEGPDWNYPLHLGVTEAGDGEDGRIKSAVGIGSLLSDGIGDTIRVSLTEDAVKEIPVAQSLVAPYNSGDLGDVFSDYEVREPTPFDPVSFQRRSSMVTVINGVTVGGGEPIRAAVPEKNLAALKKIDMGECVPELSFEACGALEIDPTDDAQIALINSKEEPQLITLPNDFVTRVIPGFRLLAARVDKRHPILLKDTLSPVTATANADLTSLIRAGTRLGSLLCDGIGDAVMVQGVKDPKEALMLTYNVLQATGSRLFKTDYVACPSCGRTLFNLQETTQRIRSATGHLKGLRIAVMGCIVNGPGEMADADFGYVGGAPGKINLYVSKTPVAFNIPSDDAVDRLIGLIKEHGKWIDP